MELLERGQRIVVIDEDEATRLRVTWELSKAGYRVEAYEDGPQGIEGATRLQPDAVLVAMRLEGLGGVDVISCLHNILPDTAILAMTAYPTVELEARAVQAGADRLLAKPCTPELVKVSVKQALSKRQVGIQVG